MKLGMRLIIPTVDGSYSLMEPSLVIHKGVGKVGTYQRKEYLNVQGMRS